MIVKMFMRLAVVCIPAVFAPISHAGDVFQFAGYTFDQRNTPNQAALLGDNQTLDGAHFSPGFPAATTGVITGFPQSSTGYSNALALGQLTGISTGNRAVNLPAGNIGFSARHGIEVGWSGHRGLTNLGGDDFVIYESAQTILTVEGLIVRVRAAPTAFGQSPAWTPWCYFPPANFQITSGQAGAFAHVYDLSNFGLATNQMIDRIQLANLTAADRIAGPGTNIGGTVFVGSGRVVFDGSTTVQPDAGPFDTDRLYDFLTLDPDPLYVAALRDIGPLPPLITSISRQTNGMALGVATASGVWRIESTDSLTPVNWQWMQIFTNAPGGLLNLLDTGQNDRALPESITHRFYRLKSE
jgi:hypothetical protein